MATRTSHRWSTLPGNFDKLHTFAIFPAPDNQYGIPLMRRETWVPQWLHPYGVRIRTNEMPPGGCLHFFLDDFRFEVLWNRPWDTLSQPLKVGYCLSPQFSTYIDWPRAIHIWNTYRNRWMACFWQSQGVRVIPTLAWADKASYDFAFAGVPRGSTVAVSTVGIRDGEAYSYFYAGYHEMVARLEPAHVVFYGLRMPADLERLAPVTKYPTRWDSIREVKAQIRAEREAADRALLGVG